MNKNLMVNVFQSLPKLIRLEISIVVSFSAATGYLVAKSQFDFTLLFVIVGVFLMAGGASALNQYQERVSDALMLRTKNRPIPSGKISPTAGLITAIVICLLGFVVLYLNAGVIPASLGLLNILWYNGLYTFLKKKTAFAVVPGSLTGVTPLLIGWSSAGANIFDPTIVLISFFIYMWQIPHFWLLLIKFNEDYLKAGLGSLFRSFSTAQVKRIVFVWVISTSLASLMLPYFGVVKSLLLVISLIILNVWLAISFYRIIFDKQEKFNFKKAFMEINAFMVLVMSILIVESLIV